MPVTKLLQKVEKYNPKADPEVLREAYVFAAQAHAGQKRISGEPYITHPLAVAIILADLELDLDTLVAGLLHDVVEDTEVSLTEIEKKFGAEVALLVDGVTKLSRIAYKSKEEQQAENLRKMFLAMAKDIRVILIKLADRLHNLRTLKYQTPEKQREIAEETLEIFAPLAHRLGIYKIKWELEDLAFRFLEPENYYHMVKEIATTRSKREEYIHAVIAILKDKLKGVGIKAEIEGRPKHFYSIYEKMRKQQKEFSQIFDVMAVRVIVETVRDCYAILGMVHTMWKPIPGRFKDYIAMPKSNMYQSLHTTVIGPHGDPLEIQIRTWEMHRTAEFGIAAHWRYKEGGNGKKGMDEKLAWLRQLLEWQHDLRDAGEFMETLKIDLFTDAVFVFTPRGDVVELPAGSVPLDFAYRIHTDIGHRCIGAKVNGKIVPLDYKLHNGDIVEVMTSKQANGPSRDWLNLVQTSQAKNKIRQWFKKERRDENIVRGREILEREAKKAGLDGTEIIRGEKLLEIGRRLNLLNLEDIFAAIGDGTITVQQVLSRWRDELRNEKKPEVEITGRRPKQQRSGKATEGIRVKGVDNLLVRLARCCNPVPGDPVIGYITRGRGVSVHRADCLNAANLQGEGQERMVEVTWDDNFQAPFQVKLEVSGLDRAGFLNDVMTVLSDLRISANWVTARGRKDGMASIEMVLEVRGLEQLEFIMSRIRRVKDVFDVQRVNFGSAEKAGPLEL